MYCFAGAILIIFSGFFVACPCCELTDKYPHSEDLWQDTHGKIIFSAVVFRHGDRHAFDDFPTNEHSATLKKLGFAKLTKGGKYRAYKLGLWLRARYNRLIDGQPYNAKLINMISSHSERSVVSGELVLAGFYPPVDAKKEVWNDEIPWQPIPVFTNPPFDRMFTMREYCALYIHEMERIKHNVEIRDFYEKHKDTIEYMKEHSKFPVPDDGDYMIRSIQRTSVLYDIIYSQDLMGLKVPDWAKRVYPSGKYDITIMFYRLHTFTEAMKRVKAGPLLDHIIKQLKKKRDNPESEKLIQFYSGHDANIIALMDAMGVWERILTPFSAALIFELRKLNDDYIITVSYRDSEDEPLQLMKIPNCSNPCTLDDFITITKPVVPEDWDKECRTLKPNWNMMLF